MNGRFLETSLVFQSRHREHRQEPRRSLHQPPKSLSRPVPGRGPGMSIKAWCRSTRPGPASHVVGSRNGGTPPCPIYFYQIGSSHRGLPSTANARLWTFTAQTKLTSSGHCLSTHKKSWRTNPLDSSSINSNVWILDGHARVANMFSPHLMLGQSRFAGVKITIQEPGALKERNLHRDHNYLYKDIRC